MDSEKVGKFIAELRKEKKWTQEDLAQKLIVDRGTISKWERGIYIPNTELLLKLQDLFDISVNEILYGERRNKGNNKNIDNVTIEVLKDNKRKIKKILFSSAIIIVLLVILFLTYYFINNYNSISIYRINGENENFNINDGILIVSKEKSYIKLGILEQYTKNDSIENIRLFYNKKGKEYNIFSGTPEDTNNLLINTFNYNELFEYKDINYIKKGLFLEIMNEDNIELIPLKLEKDFANDSIFNDKINSVSNNNEVLEVKSNIPKYIKENFEFDAKNNEYYFKNKRNNQIIYEKYLPELQWYIVIINQDDYEEYFEYYILDNTINYYVIKNENIINNFIYNLSNQKCESGDCNITSINNFKSVYLDKIDFSN